MIESQDDIDRLQKLIDHSIGRAGAFLRSSLEIPAKSLNAQQIVRRLSGPLTVALATVSSTGMPRVAPVLAYFYRGEFHVPTVRTALRARHIRNNPATSLTHFKGNDFAMIVHGNGAQIDSSSREFQSLVQLQQNLTGEDVRDWGDAVYIRVEPTHFFTFARYPEQFPE